MRTTAAERGRLVVGSVPGKTTKADCLNRLYRALCDDERRTGTRSRMIVLHDAEDMVDPAALALLDRAIAEAPPGFDQFGPRARVDDVESLAELGPERVQRLTRVQG